MIERRNVTRAAAPTMHKETHRMMSTNRIRTAATTLALAAGALLALAALASAKVIHEQEATFPLGSPFSWIAVDNSADATNGDLWIGEMQFGGSFASRVYQTDAGGTPTGVELDGSQTPAGSFRFINLATFGLASGPAVDGSTGPEAGHVYVPDVAHGVVDLFDENGDYLCQITGDAAPLASECAGATGSETPAGGLQPTAVAVDPSDGSVAVGDARGTVYEFSQAGEFQREVADPHITGPSSLAFDSAGNLYVVNANALSNDGGSAVKFNSAGDFVYELLSDDQASVGVNLADDNVYVGALEGGIQQFDPAGSPVSVFGESDNPVLSVDVNKATGKVYVSSVSGHIWSGEIIVPAVGTGPASGLGETSVTLNGSVDPEISEGGSTVESCEFQYGLDEGYGQTALCAPTPPYADATDVSADLTNLDPSTTYHYRLEAENADSREGQGEDRTFTTRGPASIGERPATAAADKATVRAKVNPFGLQTSCLVEYVTDAGFQSSGYDDAKTVPCDQATLDGFGDHRVEAEITGLDINTAYHYRFVATNSAATTRGDGEDDTFTTFGIESFSMQALDENGDPYTQAGGHPYELVTDIRFNSTIKPQRPDCDSQGCRPTSPSGNIRNVVTELPVGLVGNPTVAETCQLVDLTFNQCGGSSQVGTVQLHGHQWVGNSHTLNNMVPPKGVAARLGFLGTTGVPVFLDAKVRSDGDYGITVASLKVGKLSAVEGITVNIWGVPADPSHDSQRRCFGAPGGCPSGIPPRPFLTNPTSCTGPRTARVRSDSWGAIGKFDDATDAMPALTGCERLPFDASITTEPTTARAASPSGLDVELSVPRAQNPSGLAQAHLRHAEVTLPEGMAVNPSSANGLGACSEAEIGLDSAEPASCPDSAKIGSVEIDTPLLEERLSGAVYLAEQGNKGPAQGSNPFDSLLALYIVAESKERGVVIKLPGKVEPDPDTGQLTATFANNPQLPFTKLRMHLKGGDRAPLVTPSTCGTKTTRATLTPWSAPDSGAPEESTDSFEITKGPSGGPCVSDLADRPFNPNMNSGVTSPVAGASTPFTFRLTREDGEQEILSTTVTPPKGVTAKLAGVPLCSNARANAGTCPAASQVGEVIVGAGAGPSPFYIQPPNEGHVYMTEGYKGEQLGMLIQVPAKAGPFDLGLVNVRAAVYVDKRTAQLRVQSDPIPQILEGIPLRTKDIRVLINRPDFTIAPTDCDPMAIYATVRGSHGARAALRNRFQVGGCAALGFSPKLKLDFGKRRKDTRRNQHPPLHANLNFNQGDANISYVQVALPKGVFLDQDRLGRICSRANYAASTCPAESRVGYAKATTPLLDNPVEGPVYLKSSDNPLPDLAADLNGQIDIDLFGKIDQKENKKGLAQIRNTFDVVPDVPVSHFSLTLSGGKDGLLVNSRNICRKRRSQKISIEIRAHNEASLKQKPLIGSACKKINKKKAKKLRKKIKKLRRKAKKANSHKRAKRARHKGKKLKRKLRKLRR